MSVVQGNKVAKITLRFEEWLTKQQEREDRIGDLARVPSMQDFEGKSSRRSADEHKNWTEIVIRIGEPGYVAVFNWAWQEFQLAKEAAEDAPD